MSDQQSKLRKQAEVAFAKEQNQPISMPGHERPANKAEENLGRQKAARLARDVAQISARKR